MKRSFQIHITQEKTVDLNKTFSSSLHNFRYIDDYLDGSAQELSESQYVEERGIKRSFQRQNLPRIYLPTFVKNWEEDRKEDIQSLLSDASESFEMGTQSSSFNNVEANFASEGKNSPEKHEAFTCSPSYASETSEMGAPSSNSNTASNFVSKVKAVHETKDDFKCLPFYEEELLDMEAQSSSYNNAAANSSSEVKAESKKPKTQKSFRSKMFSMFNGVRKFHGRMLTAAREYENYKKQNNQTNDSLH
ncbi:hypothetical protein JTE90_000602 [Oedothorax gibbosus]|uniref:Uncharacterized protein n=1 Tax=Oedothorax gibbosus TaxID=931172 RepID=A0AAV6VVJ4_9ARAC|nr:hypothetical protein JTE90_000602 [Oedothorax gibbosus]